MPEKLLKSEWEVLQELLQTEKGTLKELEKQYRVSLMDIEMRIAQLLGRSDAGMQHVIRQVAHQQMLRQQVQSVLGALHAKEYDTISEFLQKTYTDAFVGTAYTLYEQGIPVIVPIDQTAVTKAVTIDSKLSKGLYDSLGIDLHRMKKTIVNEITRGIASGAAYSEIARNIENLSGVSLRRAQLITRTEAGRVQEQASFDAAQKAMAEGADLVKQWSAMRDTNTRDSHRILDGQVREMDEPFSNGLQYPHDPSGAAGEVINCRCTKLTRARAALGKEDLLRMQERAAAAGLLSKDKATFWYEKERNFTQFKEKYLKAAEKIGSKLANASVVEANGRFVGKTEKLFRYAKNIPPLEGYEDFTCHATTDYFFIDLGGKGNEEDYFMMTPKEYAEKIIASSSYQGGNVRIISCQSGAKKDGAAQLLADALGVDVLAPTETVHVTEKGEMFLSNNRTLAEIWYNEGADSQIKQTGEWKVFKPRKE